MSVSTAIGAVAVMYLSFMMAVYYIKVSISLFRALKLPPSIYPTYRFLMGVIYFVFLFFFALHIAEILAGE